jgi:hypothetical protein
MERKLKKTMLALVCLVLLGCERQPEADSDSVHFSITDTIETSFNGQMVETVKGEFIKKGRHYVLNLPYEIGDDINYVFDEDTPDAIDIIDIRADGLKLFLISTPNSGQSRTYFNIRETTEEKKYHISMYWYNWGDVLNWSNGGRSIPTRESTNAFKGVANTYEMSRGMRQLEIRYRILLPYSSITTYDLYNKTYIENFSKDYKMVVDIANLFDE